MIGSVDRVADPTVLGVSYLVEVERDCAPLGVYEHELADLTGRTTAYLGAPDQERPNSPSLITLYMAAVSCLAFCQAIGSSKRRTLGRWSISSLITHYSSLTSALYYPPGSPRTSGG